MITSEYSFEVYVSIEFYQLTIKKLRENIDVPEMRDTLVTFVSSLTDENDPMIKVEELANYPNSSEISILLMDLFEKVTFSEDKDLFKEMIETQAENFVELLSLLYEEEEVLNTIRKFIKTHKSRIETSEAIKEKEVEKIEKNNEDEEKYTFIDALKLDLLEKCDFKNQDHINFLHALFNQIHLYKKLVECFLPSEVSNVIILVNELLTTSGENFYTKFSLIKQNIENIDSDTLEELKNTNFEFLTYFERSVETETEKIPQIDKPEQASVQVDKTVKEKVRKYYQHEVHEAILVVEKLLNEISEYKVVNDIYNKLYQIFTDLKNISIIHGYEGIQTVADEMLGFFKECESASLVFTVDTRPFVQNFLESFRKLIEVADFPEEKKEIENIYLFLNEWNASLAEVQFIEEEDISVKDKRVFAALFGILRKKYSDYENLSDEDYLNACYDFKLAGLDTNAELLDFLRSKSEKARIYLPEIIRIAFTEELSKERFDELKIKIIKQYEQALRRSYNEKSAILNEELFTFDEIKLRNGIFESVLINKLDALIHSFNTLSGKNIVHLSNDIEIETRWMGYEQIADFFNYYSLNLDTIKNHIPELNTELELIKKSPTNYQFSVERFEEKEETNFPERVERTVDSENYLEEIDDYIRPVFIEESESYLYTISEQIKILKSNNSNRDALKIARSAAHTLKNASKILELTKIAQLADRIESILTQNNEGIEKNYIAEIENRTDTIKKIIGLKVSPSESNQDEHSIEFQNDIDFELLDTFTEESEAEIEKISTDLHNILTSGDQRQVLKNIETNAQALKSSAKILGFKEIGLLAEKIEEAAEKLQTNNKSVNIIIVEELKSSLSLLLLLREGKKISFSEIQNSSFKLMNAVNNQLAEGSTVRELGEFEQLFIDETLDKVLKIQDKIEAGDDASSIAIDFNGIKRSAALVGFDRIKNLATVTEQLCESKLKKEKIYSSISAVTEELRISCERIFSGNFGNIGKIDDLISEINEKIIQANKNLNQNISKDAEQLSRLIEHVAERIENRAEFLKKIKRLRYVLKQMENGDQELQAAVADLVTFSEKLHTEITGLYKEINAYPLSVKEYLFRTGEEFSGLTLVLDHEIYGIDLGRVKKRFEIENFNPLQEKNVVIDENRYSFKMITDLIGRDIKKVDESFIYGVLLDDDSVYLSTCESFEPKDFPVIKLENHTFIEKIGLLDKEQFIFIFRED
jgi:chemotaxis protein histidine kinase CheA